jgi:hypothetical protein
MRAANTDLISLVKQEPKQNDAATGPARHPTKSRRGRMRLEDTQICD